MDVSFSVRCVVPPERAREGATMRARTTRKYVIERCGVS
jgi:hypothetical protein